MIATFQVSENIFQAHRASEAPIDFPFSSFAQLFYERVHDPLLSKHTFLTFYDDDRKEQRTYTYAEFGELVGRTITYLRDHLGVQYGDRIATLLFNHDDTVVIYFAAWVLGAAIVPINIEESEKTKRYILDHSEASLVFCWHETFEEINSMRYALPHIQQIISIGDDHFSSWIDAFTRVKPALPIKDGCLSDEALIVYTSGTTGPPKGVVLTAENLLIDAHGISTWHGFMMGDCLMCVLPIHHVNGIVVTLLTPFYFKGKVVLNRRFRTTAFWNRIQEEKVVCASVVPTILEFLLESPKDTRKYRLDHFRGVICGAGPLLKETAARFEDRFHFSIRHGYGLSETTCYSCFLPIDLPPDKHRDWLTTYDYPSIGVPIPHNDMAILDDQGQPLPELVKGEICIRGQTVCSGYLKRPEANEAAFQWGWFRTGDQGFFIRDIHNRPFFFVSGRLKELMIRGGINIAPLEIDEVLREHPSIKFAMAVPFENRYYGEEIAGYVVLREGLPQPSQAAILEFCRRRLPFAKCPKVIVHGEDVPYTTTGKPKRLTLKTQLSDTLARYRNVRFKDVPSKE